MTLGRALLLALEHGGSYTAALVDRDFGSVRRFDIGKRMADGFAIDHFEKTLLDNTGVGGPGTSGSLTKRYAPCWTLAGRNALRVPMCTRLRASSESSWQTL